MKEINIRQLKESAVKLISDDWALVTAGNEQKWNTMTVSWGTVGELWGKDVAIIFIRPQRYTKEFLEREALFTMCFFDETYRKALAFCGSKSGRDYDKAKETGLTPIFTNGTVGFKEAKYTLICKKIAKLSMRPEDFLDPDIMQNYPADDYHIVYVGEIVKTLEA